MSWFKRNFGSNQSKASVEDLKESHVKVQGVWWPCSLQQGTPFPWSEGKGAKWLWVQTVCPWVSRVWGTGSTEGLGTELRGNGFIILKEQFGLSLCKEGSSFNVSVKTGHPVGWCGSFPCTRPRGYSKTFSMGHVTGVRCWSLDQTQTFIHFYLITECAKLLSEGCQCLDARMALGGQAAEGDWCTCCENHTCLGQKGAITMANVSSCLIL